MDFRTKDGSTALHRAVVRNNAESLRFVIQDLSRQRGPFIEGPFHEQIVPFKMPKLLICYTKKF